MLESLVTCGGIDCSICSILQTVQNIFNYLLGIASIVAVLSVTLAGLVYIFSLGNRNFLLKAKRFATFAVAGFAVSLMSFVAINASYLMMGVTDKNSWFQIDCVDENGPVQNENQTVKGKLDSRKLKFVKASSIFGSVTDPEKVTELDLATLDANNIYADALALEPGQEIVFITNQDSLGEQGIQAYVDDQGGFLVDSGGDRGEGLLSEEKVVIRREVDGLTVITGGADPQIIGESSDGDRTGGLQVFDQVVKILSAEKDQGKKVYVYNGKNQEEGAVFSDTACSDSGGDATIFQNECLARQATCGKENILCSETENELTGCQCPAGSCLQNQKCVPIEDKNLIASDKQDADGDGVVDSYDKCPNTELGEKVNKDKTSGDSGCACSQINLNQRVCPESRCEGPYFVTYAPSGQDTCVDGVRAEYFAD